MVVEKREVFVSVDQFRVGDRVILQWLGDAAVPAWLGYARGTVIKINRKRLVVGDLDRALSDWTVKVTPAHIHSRVGARP